MNIKRGDCFYIERIYNEVGSEQKSGRPAIIVSNEKNNQNSETVEVVYLTAKTKANLPTHVTIRSAPKESTALCEQVTSVSTNRIGTFVAHLTKEEMTQVDIALLISLDLTLDQEPRVIIKEVTKEVPIEVIKEVPAVSAYRAISQDERKNIVERAKTQAERDLYKKMYEDLYQLLAAGRVAVV